MTRPCGLLVDVSDTSVFQNPMFLLLSYLQEQLAHVSSKASLKGFPAAPLVEMSPGLAVAHPAQFPGSSFAWRLSLLWLSEQSGWCLAHSALLSAPPDTEVPRVLAAHCLLRTMLLRTRRWQTTAPSLLFLMLLGSARQILTAVIKAGIT